MDSRTLLQAAIPASAVQRARSQFPPNEPGKPFANRIVCSIGESLCRSSYRDFECSLKPALPSKRANEILSKLAKVANTAGCGCVVDMALEKLELSEPTISITATIQTFNPRIPLALLADIADLLDGVSFSLNPDKRQYTVGFVEQSVRNLSTEVLDRLEKVIECTKKSRIAGERLF